LRRAGPDSGMVIGRVLYCNRAEKSMTGTV
jgi:hypothetical protein